MSTLDPCTKDANADMTESLTVRCVEVSSNVRMRKTFDEHDPQSGARKEVYLVAFFKTVRFADTWSSIGFRNSIGLP